MYSAHEFGAAGSGVALPRYDRIHVLDTCGVTIAQERIVDDFRWPGRGRTSPEELSVEVPRFHTPGRQLSWGAGLSVGGGTTRAMMCLQSRPTLGSRGQGREPLQERRCQWQSLASW